MLFFVRNKAQWLLQALSFTLLITIGISLVPADVIEEEVDEWSLTLLGHHIEDLQTHTDDFDDLNGNASSSDKEKKNNTEKEQQEEEQREKEIEPSSCKKKKHKNVVSVFVSANFEIIYQRVIDVVNQKRTNYSSHPRLLNSQIVTYPLYILICNLRN